MSFNSSSSNISFPLFGFSDCYIMAGIIFSNTAFNITKFLLLVPLSVFILYLAYQKWKQQGSLTAASHCDVFTYHQAVMELFTLLGIVFSLIGSYIEFKGVKTVGDSLLAVPYCGEAFFHVLTCGERYLAVVHPLTYRGLKTARGIRIRNVIIGSVWVLCFAWTVSAVDTETSFYIGVSIMAPWLAVVFFCSVSVLFVLIRSRPGEKGRGKVGFDKSKQKAVLTIIFILVVLWLWVVSYFISLFVTRSTSSSNLYKCVVPQIAYWINIPCSLVLPLMYLQRSGKLSFCCFAGKKR